jgi:type IV pilus biogenesis protein CpaD/CtpE
MAAKLITIVTKSGWVTLLGSGQDENQVRVSFVEILGRPSACGQKVRLLNIEIGTLSLTLCTVSYSSV